MDNYLHYKAVIKMTTSKATKEIQIPSNLDIDNGKFFVSSVAGKLTTGSVKYIHIESPTFANEYIYVSETDNYNVLASCLISNVVSQTIMEGTMNCVGFPIPSQLSNTAQVEFQLTDDSHVLLTNIEFVEITIVFVCPKK